MDNKPYHHLSDGTFRNPEGSPVRSDKVKWSYRQFNQENKKDGNALEMFEQSNSEEDFEIPAFLRRQKN